MCVDNASMTRRTIRRTAKSHTTSHIAIVTPAIGSAIVTGRKKIESRFYRTIRPPIGSIRPGDHIFFKAVGGPFVQTVEVTRVREFRDLKPNDVSAVRREYGTKICGSTTYWRGKRNARYGSLIWFRPVDPPRRYPAVPRQYGNGWIVLP